MIIPVPVPVLYMKRYGTYYTLQYSAIRESNVDRFYGGVGMMGKALLETTCRRLYLQAPAPNLLNFVANV